MSDNKKDSSEVIQIADVQLIKGLKKTGTCPKCGRYFEISKKLYDSI